MSAPRDTAMRIRSLIAGIAVAACVVLLQPVPAATAASISFSNASCTSYSLTDLGGGTFTITCNLPSVPVCTIAASSTTPVTGSTVTLTATCTDGPYGWLWTGAATPCGTGSSVCTDSQSTAGAKTYTVFGGNGVGHGPTASVTVNWSAPSNPPSGCTVTRTAPSNGQLPTTGGSITLTGACTGGGAPTAWQWRRNGVVTNTTTATYSETLPANTNSASTTYSYDARACVGATCGPYTSPVTTVTVAGTAPVGFCSQYSDVRFVDLNWGNPPVDTTNTVQLNPGTLIVGRLAVPAGATSPGDSPGTISIVEFMGPTAGRVMTLSTQPCDFRGYSPGFFPAPDATGANGPLRWEAGINPNTSFLLFGDPAGFPAKPLLTPGQTYYVNLQTINYATGQNSCPTGSCDVRFTVDPPR
jgi:hypothetical protein